MKGPVLSVGFIPLMDAVPLIVAQEMGFAAQEGLALDLVKAPSWSSLRDMLVFGRVDAAHMLSAVPVAAALGLGGTTVPLSAIMVLSANGAVIGVNAALADKLRGAGHRFGFTDAGAAGRALIDVSDAPLRIGVPFPFSMHAELLYYWLSALGLPAPQGVDIRTVPPPLMAEAIKSGEIDAFCVGEPWGSIAVEQGVGTLLLAGKAIWEFAPEKVLAVREDWASHEPELSARLIRAVWHAGRWLSNPDSQVMAAELLARPEYLDLPPEIIDRSLSGHFTISPAGETRHVDRFVEFHSGVTAFPWRSQAQWIAYQMAARLGIDRQDAMRRASNVFRPDIFRAAMAETAADLPSASSKVEGSVESQTGVASRAGTILLNRDLFFDGRVFDPDAQ